MVNAEMMSGVIVTWVWQSMKPSPALAGLGTAFLVNVSQGGWDRVFTLLDAAALSPWATVGAQKALEVGLGWLPALLLGTITAVGGGITRDLMLLQVPAVFAGNRLFASVAIVVAAIVVVCSALHAPPGLGTAIAVLTGFALRLVANWRGWSLPYGLELQPRSIASTPLSAFGRQVGSSTVTAPDRGSWRPVARRPS
ncbi:hypothetical protein GCM10009735_79120 [Actinomadura chokoriensis]